MIFYIYPTLGVRLIFIIFVVFPNFSSSSDPANLHHHVTMFQIFEIIQSQSQRESSHQGSFTQPVLSCHNCNAPVSQIQILDLSNSSNQFPFNFHPHSFTRSRMSEDNKLIKERTTSTEFSLLFTIPALKYTKTSKVLFTPENYTTQTYYARRFSSHQTLHFIFPKSITSSAGQREMYDLDTRRFLDTTLDLGAPHRDFFIFSSHSVHLLRKLWEMPILQNFKHKFGIIGSESRQNRGNPLEFKGTKTKDDDESILLGFSELVPFESTNGGKKVWRVSTFSQPPYVTLDHTGKIVTGGSNHLVLAAISDKLNYTMEIRALDRKSGGGTGIFKNGTWTGNTGAVHYRKFDIAQLVSATVQRSGVIDFCYSQPSSLIFVTGLPQVKLKWQAIFYPFAPNCWALIILFFFLSSAVFILYYLYFPQGQKGTSGAGDIFDWAFMGYIIILQQGFNIEIPPAIKFFSTVYMFFVLIVSTGYNSDLVSYFSIRIPEKIPRDFGQLAQRKDFHILFNWDGGTASQYFTDSKGEPASSIKRRYTLQPNKAECVISAGLNDRTACITWDTVAKTRVSGNLSLPRVGKEMAVYSKPIVIYSSGFGLQKNSKYSDSVCGMTGRMRDAGLVDKWNGDVYRNFTKMGMTWKSNGGGKEIDQQLQKIWLETTETLRPLEIQNVIAIFVIWASSLPIIVTFWIGEIYYARERSKESLIMIHRPRTGIKVTDSHTN